MPSKSKEQAKLMAMACHNPEMAKKTGIPHKVACDFNKADAKTGILKDSEGNVTDWHNTSVAGNVVMDIPLLIRILEYAREELKSDNELHTFVERLIECQGTHEVLDMSCFDKIVPAMPEVDEGLSSTIGASGPSTIPGSSASYAALPRKNYSKKAMAIIDGAISAIAPLKTGRDRLDILKAYCKEHKVNFQQVYDAITVETGADYFTSNTVDEAKGVSINAVVDNAITQVMDGNIGVIKGLRVVRHQKPGIPANEQPLAFDVSSLTDRSVRHRGLSKEALTKLLLAKYRETVDESFFNKKLSVDQIIDKAKTDKNVVVGKFKIDQRSDPHAFDTRWTVSHGAGPQHKVDEKGLRHILSVALGESSMQSVSESIVKSSKNLL